LSGLERHTVGCGGDLGLVRNAGNGTEGLWGLSVGRDLTSGVGVHSWGILVVTVADGILVWSVTSWSNIVAAHTIEDVVAVRSRISHRGVACLETKKRWNP